MQRICVSCALVQLVTTEGMCACVRARARVFRRGGQVALDAVTAVGGEIVEEGQWAVLRQLQRLLLGGRLDLAAFCSAGGLSSLFALPVISSIGSAKLSAFPSPPAPLLAAAAPVQAAAAAAAQQQELFLHCVELLLSRPPPPPPPAAMSAAEMHSSAAAAAAAAAHRRTVIDTLAQSPAWLTALALLLETPGTTHPANGYVLQLNVRQQVLRLLLRCAGAGGLWAVG
jgi:hypothetical protein